MWDNAMASNLSSLMMTADGNYYYLPKYSEQMVHLGSNARAFIYEPWMEALKLELPTTTKDFVDVLKALRDGDPNGNGKADEVGIMATTVDKNLFQYLLTPFINYGNEGMTILDDGTVVPMYTQDEYKEGLMWINSLVKEGLLAPVSFTQDDNTLKTIINQEVQTIAILAQKTKNAYMDTHSELAINYVNLLPLTNSDTGVCTPRAGEIGIQRTYYITSACEHPAVAYRLGDFMLSYEAVFRGRYGVENQNWEKVTDPSVKSYDGGQAQYRFIEDVWSYSLQNVHIVWPSAGYMKLGVNEAWVAPTSKTDDAYYEWSLLQYSLDTLDLVPEKFFSSNITRTAEEQAVYDQYHAQITTYYEENMYRFASGDRPFSEWDAYIAEFSKLGLTEYMAQQQSAYDRSVGK